MQEARYGLVCIVLALAQFANLGPINHAPSMGTQRQHGQLSISRERVFLCLSHQLDTLCTVVHETGSRVGGTVGAYMYVELP